MPNGGEQHHRGFVVAAVNPNFVLAFERHAGDQEAR